MVKKKFTCRSRWDTQTSALRVPHSCLDTWVQNKLVEESKDIWTTGLQT